MEGIMMRNVDKKEIESAIEEINDVIVDFTDTVDSLTGVKNLLYKLLENDAKNEADSCVSEGKGYLEIAHLIIDPENGDVSHLKILWKSREAFNISMTGIDGTHYIGSMKIIFEPIFDYEKNTASVIMKGYSRPEEQDGGIEK
jgi:hypothetical protein